MSGCRVSRGGSDGTNKNVLILFRDDDDNDDEGVVDVTVGAGLAGDAFRKLEADIDMGGLAAAAAESSFFSSLSSKIGCRILPGVEGPPNDLDPIAASPPPTPNPPLFPLLSHDKVRGRGVLYSPPVASVRDDRKE